jgi:hypothetical protein
MEFHHLLLVYELKEPVAALAAEFGACGRFEIRYARRAA